MRFKKTLTGLLLGALLSGNAYNLHSETLNFPEFPKESSLSEIQFVNLGTIMEDIYLLHYDEYVQTKPSLENYPKLFSEGNPLWRPFFNKNLWSLPYAMSVGGLLLGNYILNKVDQTGRLAGMFNIAVGVADYMTILSNYSILKKRFGDSLPDKQKNVPILYFNIKM